MEIVERRVVPGLARLYLARLRAGRDSLVEFVDTVEPGVPKRRKWVMMLSTQFGCAIGCAFCDAGAMGFGGNLTADEMLAQARAIAGANPGLACRRHPKIKVHFARMGEPTLNPAVIDALARLPGVLPGPGLVPSVSTVAPKTPAAERFLTDLARLKDGLFPQGRFQLQFSVHSTDEDARAALTPVKKWSLAEIAAFGRVWHRPGDRKITLNFAAPEGVPLEAGAVARCFDPSRFLVKITPVNPTRAAVKNGRDRLWHRAPAPVRRFAGQLSARGFDVIVSPSAQSEVDAATSCGQLWSDHFRGRAERSARAREKEGRCYASERALGGKARSWLASLSGYRRRFEFDPAKAALLVVDMQDFFLDPAGPAYLPAGRAVLGRVERLLAAFRAEGRPVLFTVHAYRAAQREGGLMTRWWRKACLAGTPQARVTALLAPRPGEPVFRKCRYSAFSSSAVSRALSHTGASQLVVAGVMTNLCVESTARDAFSRGWEVFIPADGTAAAEEALHLASLRNAAYGFAAVVGVDELLPSSS